MKYKYLVIDHFSNDLMTISAQNKKELLKKLVELEDEDFSENIIAGIDTLNTDIEIYPFDEIKEY